MQLGTLPGSSRWRLGSAAALARPLPARQPWRCARSGRRLPAAPAALLGSMPSPGDGWISKQEEMEQARKEQRFVYDTERWERHRSASRYFRHLLAIPKSRMLQGVLEPMFYVMGLATAVALYDTARQAGLLPAGAPELLFRSMDVFGFASFVLSLLLVFRTNASYGRWDEARKMWGVLLQRSRDLTRQGLAWIPPEQQDLRDMLCRFTPAFSKALMTHLRKGEDLSEELQGILLPYEADGVLESSHRPNYVLQVLGCIIQEARLPTAPTVAMDMNVTALEDVLGGCERILRTPIPLDWSRHSSRCLILYLTFLPFSLWGTCGWFAVPFSGLITFLLLGIKEITISLEEPFSVLALEAICAEALENVRELQALHDTIDVPDGNPLVLSAADIVALAALEQRQLEAAYGVEGRVSVGV